MTEIFVLFKCGHLSNTYEDYILHDKTHPLKCEKCEKKVFGHLALKIHMKKHDEVKAEKIACDICGSLVTIGSLKNHKESVNNFFLKRMMSLLKFSKTIHNFISLWIDYYFLHFLFK